MDAPGGMISLFLPRRYDKILNVQEKLVAVAEMLFSSEELLTEKGDVQARGSCESFIRPSIDRNQ